VRAGTRAAFDGRDGARETRDKGWFAIARGETRARATVRRAREGRGDGRGRLGAATPDSRRGTRERDDDGVERRQRDDGRR